MVCALRAKVGRQHGKSRRTDRCTDACQLCATATRRLGSTAKVLNVVAPPAALKPLAIVSGFAGSVFTLKVVENGGCCASSEAIGR